MTLFVISDTHFGHANILTFRGQDGALIRPGFSSVEEMDEFMVERWNSVVRPSDHVYHLGDVTMKAPGLGIVKRLNGKKRLVRGNHDIFRTRLYLNAGFEEIHGVRVLEGWVLTHIPIHPESLGRFKGNIHGHIHERVVRLQTTLGSIPDPRYVNVGVERTHYTPVALESIKVENVSNV